MKTSKKRSLQRPAKKMQRHGRQSQSNKKHTKSFLRYVFSGCLATVVNLSFVWFSMQLTSYEIAVVVGAVFGTTTTYIMTKVFVFEKREKAVDYHEILRFICVHGVVCVQIWIVSVSLERWILPMLAITQYREAIASLIGVGSVVFTGYFLHRLVTYRVGHPAV